LDINLSKKSVPSFLIIWNWSQSLILEFAVSHSLIRLKKGHDPNKLKTERQKFNSAEIRLRYFTMPINHDRRGQANLKRSTRERKSSSWRQVPYFPGQNMYQFLKVILYILISFFYFIFYCSYMIYKRDQSQFRRQF